MNINRSVLYKRFIPREMNDGVTVSGTGCYENDFSLMGHFLGWGLTSINSYDSPSTQISTIALIEASDGTVLQLETWQIKFIK